MNQRWIGDVEVSEIGLGGMPMSIEGRPDEARSVATIHAALDAGVTLIDTADAYPVPPDPTTAGRTEEILGKWLRGRRDRFVLATKCRIRVGTGPNDEGLSRKHVLKAAEASLRRLQTDYLDLYQIHFPDRPMPWGSNPTIFHMQDGPSNPIEETLHVMGDLVKAGKVKVRATAKAVTGFKAAKSKGARVRKG